MKTGNERFAFTILPLHISLNSQEGKKNVHHKSDLIQIKRKTIIYFIVILIALASVTPVLADYLGPNRTVTGTTSACKVILYECKYVPAKDDWRYKKVDDWSCSNESKPWQGYSSQPSGCS